MRLFSPRARPIKIARARMEDGYYIIMGSAYIGLMIGISYYCGATVVRCSYSPANVVRREEEDYVAALSVVQSH